MPCQVSYVGKSKSTQTAQRNVGTAAFQEYLHQTCLPLVSKCRKCTRREPVTSAGRWDELCPGRLVEIENFAKAGNEAGRLRADAKEQKVAESKVDTRRRVGRQVIGTSSREFSRFLCQGGSNSLNRNPG